MCAQEATTVTLSNPAKERMRGGEAALGMNIRLGRSGDVARVARATGHDFIFIDVQHSIFGLETIGHIAQTALACSVAPIVRVRGVHDPDVAVLLDNGVLGIVFPDVNTAAEAREGVALSKFAPLGRRSVTGGYPFFDYRSVPTTETVPVLNDATLVVCMIETLEGLANLEEIAAVEGVDVIHVGTNDLLVAMGKPGQFDAPEIVEALDRTIAAAEANGKYAGCGGNRDVGRQVDLINKGMRFVTTQTDIGFMAAAASSWTTSVRQGLAGKTQEG